jgi:hypothetical protein
MHIGVKSKNEDSKTEAMHFSRPGQKSSVADMDGIEIDEDRCISFCIKFKYLGTLFFMPELNDTANITARISQARKLFNSMNRQVLSNKRIPIDIRRRLYQAIVVNHIELWGSESWALKRYTIAVSAGWCNCTMWVIKEKRITNEKVRRTAANSPSTESTMEVRRCR